MIHCGFKKGRMIGGFRFSAVLVLCLTLMSCSIASEEPVQVINGNRYVFDKKTQYTFNEPKAELSNTDCPLGEFTVAGNSTYNEDKFFISRGNLTFSYTFDESKLSLDATSWHITDDTSKKVDTIDLDEKINSGAVIVETSLNGEEWVTDTVLTDVFKEESVLSQPIYTTKDVQQQNGCFYRVVVAYELEKEVGSHKVAFVTVKDKETKRVAEVYELYAVNEDEENQISAEDTPRKEIGSKAKVKKDTGFAEVEVLDKDDSHYGWDLGAFTVNGYTRETKDDEGNTVFLKNVGDKVALWFTLKQDIDCLNQDNTLSIAEDTDAYDQYFEIERTSFGRGTLIIRHTDYQGVKHEPIIYTNYLAANARTGADTKVQLFEEGDYEVSLDYSIKNNPRKVGAVSIIPTYTDYKISFCFSIRNGNCMVFPFDSKTFSELADKAITPNGFRLDMAKSRYLTIDVERQVITVGSDGTISTDTRFNRPAKDNETYSDEGIYIFTVKNLYTDGEPTKKTIYVGSDKYLATLSKSGLTVEELNQKILNGYVVEENGRLAESATLENDSQSPTEEVAEQPVSAVRADTESGDKSEDTETPAKQGIWGFLTGLLK